MSANDRALFSDSDILAIGPWSCRRVSLELAPANRIGAALPAEYIESLWAHFEELNPHTFNGSMVGLVDIIQCSSEELRMQVKETTYANYIATRDLSFENMHPGLERANPLGITIILVSADKQVATTRRAAAADQNPGLIYFLGGYMVPPSHQAYEDAVVANARREILEEIGVSIAEMFVLGLAKDPIFPHPELFLVGKAFARASELAEAWQCAQDRQEASHLDFVSLPALLATEIHALTGSAATWSYAAGISFLQRCWNELEAIRNTW